MWNRTSTEKAVEDFCDQCRCCNKVTRLFSSRWTSGEVFLSRWTSGEVFLVWWTSVEVFLSWWTSGEVFLLWWTSVEVTSFTVDFWQSISSVTALSQNGRCFRMPLNPPSNGQDF